MQPYEVGGLMQFLREQQKLPQKEIYSGLCSPGTYSKIESNTFFPDATLLECLFQRLGTNVYRYFSLFFNHDEFEYEQKRQKVSHLINRREYTKANKIISELKETKQYKRKLDKQRLDMYQLLIDRRLYGKLNIESIINILSVTLLDFSEKNIDKYRLTIVEVYLINLISNQYKDDGDLNKGLEILEKVKSSMDKSYFDNKQKAVFYPIILFNLSNRLGLTGRYNDCIELCEYAIRFCIETGEEEDIFRFLFNKGWCLEKMGGKEEALPLIKTAYSLTDLLEDDLYKSEIAQYAENTFGVIFY